MVLIALFLCGILLVIRCVWIYFFVADEWKYRKDAPYVNSYWKHYQLLWQHRDKIHVKKILDMWCGDGEILRFFVKKMAFHRGVGYDIRIFPILIGRFLNRLFYCKNITLVRDSYMKATLHWYDVIYLFLWKNNIAQLENYIRQWIDENTIVITNTFHFTHRKPYDVMRNEKGKVVFQLYKKSNL